MKFREDRPFAGVDAAVKKLLEIANGLEPDHAGRIHVGAINALFMSAGGDPYWVLIILASSWRNCGLSW